MNLLNLLNHFKKLDWIELLIPEEINVETYHVGFDFGYVDFSDRFVNDWYLEKDALGDLILHIDLCVR